MDDLVHDRLHQKLTTPRFVKWIIRQRNGARKVFEATGVVDLNGKPIAFPGPLDENGFRIVFLAAVFDRIV